MKMAIIGSGPQALFCARHFDHLGAHVTLFQRGPLGGNITFLKERFPAFPVALNNEVLSAHDFFEKELVALVNEVEEREIPQVGNVLRVHKRFLHPLEAVPGRTRLYDLFRVIYSTNPQDTILKQLEENPDFFKQLGDEVINSLYKPVESFADFDIVIDASGMGATPNPMGAGKAHALNENNLKDSSLLYYEKDIFTKLDLKDKKNIILIGEGISQKLALLYLKEWLLSDPSHSLHWVTYREACKASGIDWLDSQVDAFLGEVQTRFDKNKEQFEVKLREWRDLEDFVKVKIPKPVEPVPLLVVYEGYDVTSVDRLLDRKGVFATIESPDFRADSKKSSDMMTLSADALCIARGFKEEKLSESLHPEEPGFYQLKAQNLKTLNHDLIEIEKKILNFFRRAAEE
jgi:hypothetical protein